MFKPRVWVAATIICLLYWGTWHSYHDDPEIQFKTNTTLRHIINYSLLLAVALTGVYGWKNHFQPWVLKLWIFIYAVVIFFLSFFGILDIFFGISNLSFRNLIANLRLFFTCPVPYGVLIFFAKRADKLSFTSMSPKK